MHVSLLHALLWPSLAEPLPGPHYVAANKMYGPADAAVHRAMLTQLRPGRVLEGGRERQLGNHRLLFVVLAAPAGPRTAAPDGRGACIDLAPQGALITYRPGPRVLWRPIANPGAAAYT